MQSCILYIRVYNLCVYNLCLKGAIIYAKNQNCLHGRTATDSIDVLRDLMKSGMNVARFNFSHGDYETQKRRFDMVCRLRNELGLPIATMLDTKGPEVRLGKFENDEPVKIQDGDTYTLTTRDILCNAKEGCVSFKRLPHDISAGNRILINDGVVELLAEKVTETDIICRIIHGGVLSNNKGINVPGVKLSMPFLSDADMNDLEFGAKQGFDFIAASFVRTAADINYLRKFTQSLLVRCTHHCQDRESGGRGKHRRDPGGCGRHHGCPGRHGRGDPL